MEYIRCNKKGSLSNIGVQAAVLRLVAFSSGKGVPSLSKRKGSASLYVPQFF